MGEMWRRRLPRWSARSGLRGAVMPRDGAIIFRDLVSKLDVLDIEWDKSDRVGTDTTSIAGRTLRIHAKLFDWSEEITADCPRK
jgi:hypothetical protein